MHVQLRHKKVIEGAIIVLALLVVVLSTFLAQRSYDHYRSAALAADANELADRLAVAMEHYTLERGLTSAALGFKGRGLEALRARIAAARKAADTEWQAATALAATLEAGGDFRAVLAHADEARANGLMRCAGA